MQVPPTKYNEPSSEAARPEEPMLPIATAGAQLPFLPSSVKTETLAIGDLRGSVPASTTSCVALPEAAVSTATPSPPRYAVSFETFALPDAGIQALAPA